jgi:leucyl aminopeptidase (aminopeptidase T)
MPASKLDPLYRSVAKKVLSETLKVKKGEAVTVEAWNNGLPFARHAVAEARAMGCTAVMILEDEQAYVEGVKMAPKDALGTMGKNEYSLLSGTDAYIFVPGQALGVWSKTLTPSELVDSTKYNASWYDAAKKAGLRGARMVFGYVGKDVAHMLGKSVDELVRGQLKAALGDYGVVTRHAGRVASELGDGTEVSLQSAGSSLRFALKGEMEVEDGIVDEKDVSEGGNMTYMPPGLVTKEVDPPSVNGTLKVSESLTKFGLLPGAEFEFKEGKLVSWKSRDMAKLEKLLKPIAEEKRRLILMGMGLNPVLRYGFAQDRFVRGSVTLAGLGFNAVVRNASLSAGGHTLLNKGSLA